MGTLNKNRIIINNKTDFVSEIGCMQLVHEVILGGRISNNGKQYCYVTTFKQPKVIVLTAVSKTTDTFTIINDDRE